jgi:hypothetical protein
MDPETDDPIDEALRGLPVWTPPSGFARRVAIRGVEHIQAPPAPTRSAWPTLQAVTRGTLAGIGTYGAAYLLESLVTSAWIWVAVAYGVAGFAARRSKMSRYL